jgi:hypothetical protein
MGEWLLSRRDRLTAGQARSARVLSLEFIEGQVGEFCLVVGQSVARSGLQSIAQGLPRVVLPPELALKGPGDTAIIGSEPHHGNCESCR